jgi:hypothetical protein
MVFNLFPAIEGEFYCPELYTHQISSGDLLYAMVFKPHCFQPGKKYPTVLNIYGGPEVQLVSNTFKVGMLVSIFLTHHLKKHAVNLQNMLKFHFATYKLNKVNHFWKHI